MAVPTPIYVAIINTDFITKNTDFTSNCIAGETGAKILIEAVNPENTKIKEFLVDLTLPMPIFELLFRKGGGKAKGKGKKGKGKK